MQCSAQTTQLRHLGLELREEVPTKLPRLLTRGRLVWKESGFVAQHPAAVVL